MSTHTTIQAVVDYKHPNGTTVTVKGLANGRRDSDQDGQPTASFLLISYTTAVRVYLEPDVFAHYGHLIAPAEPPRGLRPQEVTVTGAVGRPSGDVVPAITATEISSEEATP